MTDEHRAFADVALVRGTKRVVKNMLPQCAYCNSRAFYRATLWGENDNPIVDIRLCPIHGDVWDKMVSSIEFMHDAWDDPIGVNGNQQWARRLAASIDYVMLHPCAPITIVQPSPGLRAALYRWAGRVFKLDSVSRRGVQRVESPDFIAFRERHGQ